MEIGVISDYSDSLTKEQVKKRFHDIKDRYIHNNSELTQKLNWFSIKYEPTQKT